MVQFLVMVLVMSNVNSWNAGGILETVLYVTTVVKQLCAEITGVMTSASLPNVTLTQEIVAGAMSLEAPVLQLSKLMVLVIQNVTISYVIMTIMTVEAVSAMRIIFVIQP